MTDDEPQFGIDDCTCIPFTRQTNPPRYLNRPTDTVDMISGWERGRDCPHHAPAVPVSSPPPDQTALRERIAEALAAADGWTWTPDYDKSLSPVWQGYLKRADVVLPVLPPPVDGSAALREAADRLWALANRKTERGAGVLWAADWLRRLAAEVQQPDTETRP